MTYRLHSSHVFTDMNDKNKMAFNMKHRLKRFYKELKLLTKLRLLSIFVTVLLLLMLFVITFIFNRNFSRQQMSQYSKNSFDYAAKDLDMTIHDVIRCFTYLCRARIKNGEAKLTEIL
jgi:hypothetical protein